jgi:hypothetical protein
MDQILNIVLDLWRRHGEALLAPVWDSLVFWRTAGLGLLLLLVLAARNRGRVRSWLLRSRRAQRDHEAFRRANAVLSEQALYAELEALSSRAGFGLEAARRARLEGLRDCLDAEGNRFFSRALAARSARLVEALTALLASSAAPPEPAGVGGGARGGATTSVRPGGTLEARAVEVRLRYREFRAAVRETLLV